MRFLHIYDDEHIHVHVHVGNKELQTFYVVMFAVLFLKVHFDG